ncbi:hypothetical protein KAR91_60500 [Candidatus Pacearchaeota archaeon]|nr:hypothetical protein [Candidatus Pacearchaeota archaeon]
MSEDKKKAFRKELLDLLNKYDIIQENGSVEISIKTNGNGILSVRTNNIENL